MNSKSYKNVRLNLRFKAWEKGKLILDTTRSNKRRLWLIIQGCKADRYYIKVTYGKGRTNQGFEEIYNDGEYSNKKDLLRAFSVFTSKIEIEDYLENFTKGRGIVHE